MGQRIGVDSLLSVGVRDVGIDLCGTKIFVPQYIL